MLRAIFLALFPLPALACELPVCQVDAETLNLTQIITFEDVPSGWDPGHLIDDFLHLQGASFAERFAGQSLGADGTFDTVSGPALSPLTLMPGAPGETLSVVNLYGSNIINGYGPSGFPNVNGQGEGAIAVLFHTDQPAFSFQLLGGESGTLQMQFLNRSGAIIHTMAIQNLTSGTLAFLRNGYESDIAGFVLTNMDPQGLAIDNLRFGPPPQLG